MDSSIRIDGRGNLAIMATAGDKDKSPANHVIRGQGS